jgi:hypothetical protein
MCPIQYQTTRADSILFSEFLSSYENTNIKIISNAKCIQIHIPEHFGSWKSETGGFSENCEGKILFQFHKGFNSLETKTV